MTDEIMDEAILEYRRMTDEEFHIRLSQDVVFRSAIEAAWIRGQKEPSKNFMRVDVDGWTPEMFTHPCPPDKPNEHDPYGPGGQYKEIKRLPGAAFPS